MGSASGSSSGSESVLRAWISTLPPRRSQGGPEGGVKGCGPAAAPRDQPRPRAGTTLSTVHLQAPPPPCHLRATSAPGRGSPFPLNLESALSILLLTFAPFFIQPSPPAKDCVCSAPAGPHDPVSGIAGQMRLLIL